MKGCRSSFNLGLCKSNNGIGTWSGFDWFRIRTSGRLFLRNVMNFWVS